MTNLPLGDRVSSHVLGFLPSGQGFAFELVRQAESRALGSAHRCQAFTLTADGTWQSNGDLVYRTPDEWRCNFPGPWNTLHHWGISAGAVEQDSAGEPNPTED